MSAPERPGSLRARSLTARRISDADLVRESSLRGGEPSPWVLEAAGDVDLPVWIAAHRERLQDLLRAHGGLLFRGFAVSSAAEFSAAARAYTPELLGYLERAAARTEVLPNIFTSTELACDQVILHHHEMSYAHNWPRYVWFYCARPSAQGGATPLASERSFFPRLDPAIKRRFTAHGVMYVRNFGEGLDLTWQQAFQTTDRRDVEAYCRRSDVSFEWIGADGLRTRQVRQAVAVHPETREPVWFNHAHLFHYTSLPPALQQSLLSAVGTAGLPRNAYYGDGSEIEPAVLHEIRAGYAACSISFPWRTGDVLLLDNFLTAHGREAYRGPRSILVAMAALHTQIGA